MNKTIILKHPIENPLSIANLKELEAIEPSEFFPMVVLNEVRKLDFRLTPQGDRLLVRASEYTANWMVKACDLEFSGFFFGGHPKLLDIAEVLRSRGEILENVGRFAYKVSTAPTEPEI